MGKGSGAILCQESYLTDRMPKAQKESSISLVAHQQSLGLSRTPATCARLVPGPSLPLPYQLIYYLPSYLSR
jgi:hypothetical protein